MIKKLLQSFLTFRFNLYLNYHRYFLCLYSLSYSNMDVPTRTYFKIAAPIAMIPLVYVVCATYSYYRPNSYLRENFVARLLGLNVTAQQIPVAGYYTQVTYAFNNAFKKGFLEWSNECCLLLQFCNLFGCVFVAFDPWLANASLCASQSEWQWNKSNKDSRTKHTAYTNTYHWSNLL